jgi:hypothetical protein
MKDASTKARAARLAEWLDRPADWTAICGTLATVFILFVAPILAAPSLFIGAMPHDSLSMADIGYRMASGQIPGRDFHSAFGVMFQWQMGLAWLMTGATAGTLRASVALSFLAFAVFAAYVARTRLSNLSTIAALTAVVVMGCVPYAQATQYVGGATYAMAYNREAWVLLLLVLLYWPAPRRAVAPLAEAVSLGLLVAGCVYFKLSYGGLGLLFLAAWALRRPGSRTAAAGALIVLALFAGLLELIYGPGFNLAYLADVAAVAGSGGDRLVHILANLYISRAELIAACIFAPLLALGFRRPPSRSDLLFVLFCAGAGLLVIWQNAQVEGMATLWAAVVVLLDRPADVAMGRVAPGTAVAALGYCAFAALTLAPILLAAGQADLGAWGLGLGKRSSLPAFAGVRFGDPDPDLRPRNAGIVYGDEYDHAVADGLRLLADCPAGKAETVMDLFDPFAQAQHRPPSTGWSWRHFGHAFSMTSHPRAQTEFRSVDCIMIPSHPTNPDTTAALMTLYGPYLDAHFGRAKRSQEWTLRLRTAP